LIFLPKTSLPPGADFFLTVLDPTFPESHPGLNGYESVERRNRSDHAALIYCNSRNNPSQKERVMAKYGKEAGKSVMREMKEFKKGELKSGSGHTVKNPKQAVAIGLSEARRHGAKVPSKRD
jgi:hypothetical protein